jgi:hypothetical protein
MADFLNGAWPTMLRLTLNGHPPTSTSHVAGTLDTYHYTQVTGWDEVSLIFAQVVLEWGSSYLHLSTSWITGGSHSYQEQIC